IRDRNVTGVQTCALPISIVTYVMVISAVFTVITVIFKPKFILHSKLFASLFDVSVFWTVARLIGTVFALMTFYQVGWDLIKSEVTGQVMLDRKSTRLNSSHVS